MTETERKLRLAANPTCWALCIRCGNRERIRRRAFERRSRPRCGACGDFLEPSQAAQDDMAVGRGRKNDEDAKAERNR